MTAGRGCDTRHDSRARTATPPATPVPSNSTTHSTRAADPSSNASASPRVTSPAGFSSPSPPAIATIAPLSKNTASQSRVFAAGAGAAGASPPPPPPPPGGGGAGGAEPRVFLCRGITPASSLLRATVTLRRLLLQLLQQPTLPTNRA